MFRSQAGHMSRPPSPHRPRLAHQQLSIRTNIKPSRVPADEGQTQLPTPPRYPIPIPSEKFSKALKLYNRYRLAEGLAQRVQEPRSATEASHLNVPGPMRTQSLTSRTSSRGYPPSISTSAYDGVTDISSLISFTDNESQLSTPDKNSKELTSYNGQKVKQRVRKPLGAVAKPKAALIRHLGSCTVCRARRVQCPLEHHDIHSLEVARQAKALNQQLRADPPLSQSSMSSSSRQLSGTASSDQIKAERPQMQALNLVGVGQREELLHTFTTSTTPTDNILSPFDPLAEIPVPPVHSSIPGPVDFSIPIGNSHLYSGPYSGYQNGQMIKLGVFRNSLFICQHLNGSCQLSFIDGEALQTHFEKDHFAFTRMEPAYQYICPKCDGVDSVIVGLCYNCNTMAEIWICGSFIRDPTDQRFAPDGQDLFFRNSSSAPPFASSYTFHDRAQDFDGGMNSDFNAGANPGYDLDFDFDSFYDNGSNSDPSPSGPFSHFQGAQFRGVHVYSAKTQCSLLKHYYAKACRAYQRHRFLIVASILLVAIFFFYKSHPLLSTITRPSANLIDTLFAQTHQPSMPIVGFASIVASFFACYTYLSLQKSGRGVSSPQSRMVRCPFQNLPTVSISFQMLLTPSTFGRKAVFL